MRLRRRLSSWIGRSLVGARLHRSLLGDRGIVVAFHRVNRTFAAEDHLTRTPQDFERFCRFFRDHYDVISLSDFVTRLERKESVAGQLAITFDDGYLGNFEIAAPILKRLGLTATFFVVSGYVGTSIVPWWDHALDRHPGWMNWDQLRALRAEGFEVGAHTRNHADLGVVDGNEAECEIRGSREDFERELGCTIDLFAYPYGQRNNLSEANRERVREAGFRCCASCFGGITPSGSDPFRLHRVPIVNWIETPEQFAFDVVRSARRAGDEIVELSSAQSLRHQ